MTRIQQHCPGAGVVSAGGGLAAQRAVETPRRSGYEGAIRVVSDEPDAPYDRPPLSKQFLARALPFRSDDWYADHGIELRLSERAAGLDADARRLQLACTNAFRSRSC
jgi:3-phenylpropionate/trans-cinnamate dioxygenase ferredoxin reductase subunit